MKGKKTDKKDEVVDISTLPKINVVTSSILLNFKNQERRSKLLENLYKSTNSAIKLICRENIIDFAKEKGIFVETQTKKEPNEEEFAKALSSLILDKSIPVMREKKASMEKNEEQKKLKEELINLINNPPPIDPKKPPNPKDKKKEIQNPDDIKILSNEDFENNADLMLLFYNFPLTTNEYKALENEKQNLNLFLLINEAETSFSDDSLIAGGKAQDKNPKLTPEQVLFQKLFSAPSDSLELFKTLSRFKQNHDKNSILRNSLFEKTDFVCKLSEDKKTSSMDTYFEELIARLKIVNKNILQYNKWCSNTFFQKLTSDPNLSEIITEDSFNEIFEKVDLHFKDFEHLSLGSILYSLVSDIMLKFRNSSNLDTEDQSNHKSLLDNIFNDVEKKILNLEAAERLNSAEDYGSSHDSRGHNIQVDNPSPVNKKLIKSNKNIIKEVNEKKAEEKYERLIIDEKDLILKASMNNRLGNFFIDEIEKNLKYFRNFPGINRYLMPPIPKMEDNFRKLKKSQIYPFLDVGIPLYEKYQVIKLYEDVFHQAIPEQKFNFSDRIYSEIMNQDLLFQTLSSAMLYDCECFDYYNERDDNLFFAIYYRCPRGRVYRKNWSYRYLSKPDFDNWINVYKAQNLQDFSNQENPSQKSSLFKKNPPPSGKEQLVSNINNNVETGEQNNLKEDEHKDIIFSADDAILYKGDDVKIGTVSERTKYMFPADNGIFINKTIHYGIFNSFISYVKKDNLVFGIKNNQKDKEAEFWLKFDNDMYLTMNYTGNYNDSKVNNDCVNGMSTSINLGNGLLIQVLPNGDICQKNLKMHSESNEKKEDEVEIQRIYSSKASVIRYFNSGKIQIMYANANVCNIINGVSINTNNKGQRLAKDINNNIEYEMPYCPITIQSDPEYKIKTLIRDDKVTSIRYPDLSTLTIHSDETKIFIYPDKQKYLIEHNLFAAVEIEYNLQTINKPTVVDNRLESHYLGASDDWLKRAFNSRIASVTLPDKSKLFTFKEKKLKDDKSVGFNNVTIIERLDGTIMKIYQNGEAVLITANERESLNSIQENDDQLYNENKYLEQLNGTADKRKGGIYTIDLKKKLIWTRDNEGNYFEQHSDGNTKHDVIFVEDVKEEEIPVSEKIDASNKQQLKDIKTDIKPSDKITDKDKNKNDKNPQPTSVLIEGNDKVKVEESHTSTKPNIHLDSNANRVMSEGFRPDSPRFDGSHYINEEMNIPKTFVPPRLFIISNNNTGYELLNESQVFPFKNWKKKYHHSKYLNNEIEHDDNKKYFLSHYWITKYYSNAELLAEINSINDVKIPKKLEKISENPSELKFDNKEVLYYRNLVESQHFGPEFRKSIEESTQKMQSWFANKKTDFGEYNDPATKQELNDMMNIETRILSERQKEDLAFDYEELKEIISENMIHNQISWRTVIFDLENYIREKEKLKIIEETEFKRLPLGQTPILIDDIKQKILEDQRIKKKKAGMSRASISDEKIVQEITFVDNFFHTLKGKDISLLYPHVGMMKKKHKKDKNQDGDGNDKENMDKAQSNEANKLNDGNKDGISDEMDENKIKMMSPIVYLNENQQSQFKNEAIKIPKITPSFYKQEIDLKTQKLENELRASTIYHNMKNIEHKVDGSQRTAFPNVPYLKTTFPQAEFNEDFIYVEKMTDHRIKTSSVAKRLYFNAPSINEVRKKGQHNFLLDALEKKNTYDEMMERLNLMITSELCDPLNKMLKIDPISLNFGYIKEGTKVQQLFTIRNDDNITNRVLVRCNNVCISLELFIGGKVRPGETKSIKVVVESNIAKAKLLKSGSEKSVVDAEFEYRLNDEVLVKTKSFIYKIQINGIMLREEEYKKLESKSTIGHSISNQKNRPYVREFPKEELEVEKDSPRTLKENMKNKKTGVEVEIKKKKKKKEVTRFPPLYEKYIDDLAINEKTMTMKNSDYDTSTLPKIN